MFLFNFLLTLFAICRGDLIVFRGPTDEFQGVGKCANVNNSFEKNSSTCQCEFKRTLVTKNRRSLKCQDDLNKLLGTNSSTELTFKENGKLDSRIKLSSCIYQSTQKVEYWNYNGQTKKGVWEESSQLRNIVLRLGGDIDLDYESAKLNIEGLVLIMTIKCVSLFRPSRTMAIKTHGSRKYPLNGDFTLSNNPTTTTTTSTTSSVPTVSTTNVTSTTTAMTTFINKNNPIANSNDGNGTATVIGIVVPLIILVIVAMAIMIYLWKRRHLNKPSVGTCPDIKIKPQTTATESHYSKPEAHIYKELESNTTPSQTPKSYERLKAGYEFNHQIYNELSTSTNHPIYKEIPDTGPVYRYTGPVYREIDYEENGALEKKENIEYDKISDVIDDDYYSSVADQTSPELYTPNYAAMDKKKSSTDR